MLSNNLMIFLDVVIFQFNDKNAIWMSIHLCVCLQRNFKNKILTEASVFYHRLFKVTHSEEKMLILKTYILNTIFLES